MSHILFTELMFKHIKFTLATFTEATAKSSLEKLVDEIQEVHEEIDKGDKMNIDKLTEEYVDCIMCTLDSAARMGINPNNLRDAFEAKLAKNQAREWKKNDNDSYSHVK